MCFTDVFNFDSSTGVFKFLCSTDVFKTAKMHDYLQGKECDNPARSAKFVYFGRKAFCICVHPLKSTENQNIVVSLLI